jgi:hypothetical protein
MPTSLPTVRRGSMALYPLQYEDSFLTKIQKFCDDTEQRWLIRNNFASFTLTYNRITAYDVNNLLSFWNLMKGSFDSTWSMTIAETTYPNMHFVGDTFTAVEVAPGLFNLSLSCVQQLPD